MKNKGLIIAIIILSLMAFYFISTNKNGTLKLELKDFAVADTASLYKIFLADTQNKCVELGRGQSFCISRGDSSNMWQSYRTSDTATFYFIFDSTPNKESEGIVVVDARGNGSHVITDKNNPLVTIAGPEDEQGTVITLEEAIDGDFLYEF